MKKESILKQIANKFMNISDGKHIKTIKLEKMNEDEILIFTIGKVNGYHPNNEDVDKLKDCMRETTKNLPASIFLPDFIKVRKIKMNKLNKIGIRYEEIE